jgi:predicted regulator of Ras-like GTPase activity (Roadblock/LC7/MglB family)
MNNIEAILNDLNALPSVLGCALVTGDGIMVCSAMRGRIADDVVAGLASFLIATTRKTLEECGFGSFSRFVMNSTHGKVVLTDLGESFLVVVADQFAGLEGILPEIQDAARRVRRAAQISM